MNAPLRRSARATARSFFLAVGLVTVIGGTSAAAPGDPDATFGDHGLVLTPIGKSSEASGVIPLPNGRVFAFGTSGQKFALARYRANGTLDPSFDGDGIATTEFPRTARASAAVRVFES